MARELFGEVTHPSVKLGNQQWHSLPLSILAHILGIALLIVVPLMAGDMLPTPRSLTASFIAPAPPPAPPPPPAHTQALKPIAEMNPNAAPLVAPPGIKPESGLVATPETETTVSNLVGVVGDPGFGVVEAAPIVSAVPSAPVRVGGKILPPKKVKDISPVYSAIAQSARVQGVVILEATIGVDGRVQNVRVLRSIPLLDAAATDAVRQWQYTPTLLNGVPVAVVMTVTVNFTLR